MNVALPTHRLDFEGFLAWIARQEDGKYELIDGVVVVQQSQRWGHAKVKLEVALALRDAVQRAGVACYVASDGPLVRIGKQQAFVPDALVAPLPEPALDSLEIPDPVIVVEVLSPSTARTDVTTKLRGYFEVPSIQHCLVVDPEGWTITHYKRGAGTALETRIVSDGILALDPPAIEFSIGDAFGPAGMPTA
jgi:Uma2 family endonuclease